MFSILKSKSINTQANIVLFFCCLSLIVLFPLFPDSYYSILSKVSFSIIFIIGIILWQEIKTYSIVVVIGLIIFEWLLGNYIDGLFPNILKVINIIFLGLIVVKQVTDVVKAKRTSFIIILEAVNGYLMLGLVYSIIVSLVMSLDANAIVCVIENNFPLIVHGKNNFSCVYYSFITFTTVGYGDYIALTNVARAVSLLICISGQLYLSIIVALIISKINKHEKGEGE